MALNATTLAAALGLTDTIVTLTSGTGVSAPNYQIGDPTKGIASGVTYLLVEQELMKVSGPALGGGTTIWPVVRGELGSIQAAHAVSAPIVAGLPTDFSKFTPAIQSAVPQLPLDFQGFSAPLTGATITPTGPYHHFTGTTALVTINLPAGYIEGGEVTLVFDGSASGLTWTAAGNIAVAGTSTTAGSAVTFVFDQGSGKWHPSRLA
jgi:hypothetical protein